MPRFLGCFVKCFYFVWCKSISACKKCLGEGASKAVPARWAVLPAKVSIRLATWWRVVGNVNVKAISEGRSIARAAVYGISVVTILPCLRQFHRCPSWLVNQREKECLGIISMLAAGTCWENKKWKGWSMPMQTVFLRRLSTWNKCARVNWVERMLHNVIKYCWTVGKNPEKPFTIMKPEETS